MNEDLCVICLSTLKENDTYALSCNHKFHTKCIIDWFRSESSNGNCPCCMDVPVNGYGLWDYSGFYNSQIFNHRLKNLRKYSRLKTSPQLLKNEFVKLKKNEDELKIIKNEVKHFKNTTEYNNIIKQMRKITSRQYNKEDRIRNLKFNIVSKYPLLVLT